jgi:succinylglutamic semialdehyde dehydrogenase
MTFLINNQFQKANGKEFVSINPANQKIYWQGNATSPEQINKVVASSKKAFESWSVTSLEERMTYLEKYNTLLEEKQEFLANIICEETGKTLIDAKAELRIMIAKLKTAYQAYQERTGISKKEIKDSISLTKHKAIGVCVIFGPYNFPGHIPNGHILPALIAGNTVIFKPSNYCPKFSEEWVKLFIEAGFPAGVINMVQGEVESSEALSKHPDINAIFFTGSTRVGKILHANLAGKIDKILALELGGNNSLVVDNDFEIEEAVKIAIQSAFVSNGQRCTCARRIILIDKNNFAENFIKEFVEQSQKIEIATPAKTSFMSCLISKEQAQAVLTKQKQYLDNGASLLLEAKIQKELGEAFISPGIIAINDYDLDEEIFGPFVKIYIAKNLEDAISKSNQSEFGLASSILTKTKTNFEQFYQQSKTGLINWNAATTGAMGIAPFGGTGISGNYRPSGFYAADYCAYPVASVINQKALDY